MSEPTAEEGAITEEIVVVGRLVTLAEADWLRAVAGGGGERMETVCANCGGPARWRLLPCGHLACWRCAPGRCLVCYVVTVAKEGIG